MHAGDPFTRVIPPTKADMFQDMTEGQIVSFGFQASPHCTGNEALYLCSEECQGVLVTLLGGQR